MKTLQQYLDEADEKFNPPVVGDNFAIEIDNVLIESYIVDIAEDGYVIAADDRVLELLEHCGCTEEQELQEQERLMEIPEELEEEASEEIAEDSLAGILRAAGLPLRKIREGFAPMEFAPLEETGVAEGLDPIKKIRLNDLIELYRDATEPNAYYDRDIEDPDEVIAMIRSEFGNKIADQVAAGAEKMHYPRHGIQRSDPLGGNRPVDRITKAGKMYKQDMDFRKRMSKYRMGIDEQGVAETERQPGRFSGAWQILVNGNKVHSFRGNFDQETADRVGVVKAASRGLYNPGSGDKIKIVPVMLDRKQGVAEGFSSDLEMELHNLTKSPDMYDAIYNALGRNDMVGQHLQDMMSDVARENRLHPDDDIEQIIDIMADRLESDYGDPDISEAKYQGRTVPLGKPMKGDVKKSKVYVRGPKGNVVKVNFGDKTMRIKKNIPGRRKNFRARHNCDNPGPRWKARYWSCRAW